MNSIGQSHLKRIFLQRIKAEVNLMENGEMHMSNNPKRLEGAEQWNSSLRVLTLYFQPPVKG